MEELLKLHIKLYLWRETPKFKFFMSIYHNSSTKPVRLFIYTYIFPYFTLYPKLGATQNIFKGKAQTSILISTELLIWKMKKINKTAAMKSLLWCVPTYQIVQASSWTKSMVNATVLKKGKQVHKKRKEYKISGDRIVSKHNTLKIK